MFRHTLAHAGTPHTRHGFGRILATPDAFGLAGLAMVLIGAWFIYTGQYTPPLWITWIVGPTFWYLGIASTIVWLCWRLFRAKPSSTTTDSPSDSCRD